MYRHARVAGWVSALAIAATTLASPAFAQPGPAEPPAQPPGYEPGYAYGPPDVPPPEGYRPNAYGYDQTARAREEDRRYAESVERWAAENCYDQRRENQAAGAVIGGVLGALLGSGVAGPHDRGTGAVVGGLAGAMAGSAIGASSTSPGCPPGYYVRSGAPPFYAPGFGGGYVYAAPPGYRPWIWAGGRWSYRPYPYHRYWNTYEHRRHYDHY